MDQVILSIIAAILALLTGLSTAEPAEAQADTTTLVLFSDLSGDITRDAPAIGHAATTHDPDCIVRLGDWDHRNPGSPAGTSAARTKMRTMYRETTTCETPAGCQWETHVAPRCHLETWDDHDYTINDSDGSHPHRDLAIYEFKRKFPGTYPGAGIWREQVIGHVHVFMLDVRSSRVKGVTVLGAEQYAWLVAAVRASTAPWKLVASSVTWNPTSGKALDSWRGFPAEQATLTEDLADVTGIFVGSGDMHSNGGVTDASCGSWPEINAPHVNMNVNPPKLLGQMGCWSGGITIGHSGGGYGVIIATATTLRLETRAANGTLRRFVDLVLP